MDVAVVVEGISPNYIKWQPWNHYLEDLAKKNINVHTFYRDDDVFKKPFDAMLLHVYQDWLNKELFNRYHIMPLLEKYITYRYEFPDTVQIVLNHTDMGRRPYCIPYWRPGDPVLYRTPAYDRKELYPLSENQIWAYELLYGSACFNQYDNPRYLAGFIGSPNSPKGFREKVAIETSKVGIGVCESPRPYSNTEYNEIMSQCRIVVCPMGWGEQS